MATQTKPFVQDGDEYREMTDLEYTRYKIDQTANTAQVAQAAQAIIDAASLRASAIAKLTALGLTAAEATTLIS